MEWNWFWKVPGCEKLISGFLEAKGFKAFVPNGEIPAQTVGRKKPLVDVVWKPVV